MTAELVIEAVDLRRSYGPLRAVDGVDLEVRKGEVMALLGPNGAGKTTTVEILEGYRHRDSGTVTVLGEDPQRAGRAWRARRGVVLQDNGDLTVGECLRHFAAFYPEPADPGDLMERVRLAQRSAALVRTLSGGQRRRLDVALGLIGRPELLFLDEPTTGFDPEARRGFWSLVRDLAREATTVMLTTHYLDEAEALADRGPEKTEASRARVGSTGVSYSQVYTAGMLAGGLASTSFLNLGVAIAGERERGPSNGWPAPRCPGPPTSSAR